MRKKKGYTMTTGHYFFNVFMGYQRAITISRATKKEAVQAFSDYLKQKKDSEWLGKWDGKKFVDDKFSEAEAA